MVGVCVAQHIDIHTGHYAQACCLLEITGYAMLNQFADGLEIAEYYALPPPLLAQNSAQGEAVTGTREAANLVERAHHALCPRLNRSLERGKIHITQGALGNIDRIIVASAFCRTIANVMFWAGRDLSPTRQISGLKASHARRRHDFTEKGILA